MMVLSNLTIEYGDTSKRKDMTMPVSPQMRAKLTDKIKSTPKVKRGMEIFAGSTMSPLMEDYVGQETALQQVHMAMQSAKKRGDRLSHTLLGSGVPGLGKTSLAKLIAYHFEVGMVECSGKIKTDDLIRLVSEMQDFDILFVDEAHTIGSNADCFLSLMTEGYILTKHGPVECQNITVMLATTDVGKLSEAMVSRCLLRPQLTFYNDTEQIRLVETLSDRFDITVPEEDMYKIAKAANGNPRAMQSILSSIRDMVDVDQYNLDLAFKFSGVTPDGLDQIAQDILLALLSLSTRTASEANLGAILSESGNMAYSTKILLSRGFVEVTTKGRRLTEDGEARALALL